MRVIPECQPVQSVDDHLHHLHPEHGFVFLMCTLLPFPLSLLRFIPTRPHPGKDGKMSIFNTERGLLLYPASIFTPGSNEWPGSRAGYSATAKTTDHGDGQLEHHWRLCLWDPSIVSSLFVDGVDRRTPIPARASIEISGKR